MIKCHVCSLKTPNNTSVFKNKDPGNILDKGILIIYNLDIFPPGRKKIRSSECKRGGRMEEGGRGIKNQRRSILFSY